MATNLSQTGLEVAKVEHGDIATGGTDKVLLYASGSGSDTRLYVKSGADAQKQLGFDIDQFDALGGTGVAQGDHFIFSDAGTEKKITFSNMEDAIFGNVSGDLAVAAGGAATIQADAVEGSMLNDNVISGQTELAHADIASADELMISDGGTLKKVGLDSLRDHYYGQVSGDATIADGGALTLAANSVSQVQLDDDAVGADELAANAVVEASIVDNAVTLAKMAGITRGSIILGDSAGDPSLLAKGSAAQFLQSDGTDPSYVSISGDATVAAGGALTIGTGVVEHAMLAADCIDGDNIQDDVVNSEHIALGALDAEHYASGSIQTGHLADNQVSLAKMAGLASAKFILGDSNGDPAAVTMSGDATLSNAGVLTIASAAVEHGMLAEDIISGQAALGGATVAQADLLMLDDGPGAVKKVTFSNFEDSLFANVSGDIAVAAGGAATIQANAVEGSMLNSNVAGSGLDYSSNELSVDVSDFMANGADNRIVTATGTDAMNGEANLTFDGSTLGLAGALSGSGAAIVVGGVTTSGGFAASGSSALAGLSSTGITLSGNLSGSGGIQTVGGLIIGGAQSAFSGSVIMDSMSVGGGYGAGSGISMTNAGRLQMNENLTVDGTAQVKSALTIGADGAGVNATFHGAAANEVMRYDAASHVLQFKDSSDASILTLGGDATSEFALDVADGSNNLNKVRAAAFVTYSDESLKQDVETMNTALDTVMSLNGVEFTWKNSGERDFGFIAQEVQKVVPKAVHTASDGVQGVDYSRLTSVLVEAVKAQQIQIEELKSLLKK